MNYYAISKEEFNSRSHIRFTVVKDHKAVNCRIFRELLDIIISSSKMGREPMFILPVGILDYRYLAEMANEERVSFTNVIIYLMDEYLDENNQPLFLEHPLSFRKFINDELVSNLEPGLRPKPENVRIPHPDRLAEISEEIVGRGGADFCASGFGLNGHFAFNDPLEVPISVEAFAKLQARIVTITPVSCAQMAIGGTGGNLEILPRRAVTLGMKELLVTKKIHLGFVRSWHAGVLRRAIFGPVTAEFPGSLLQRHPNVEVTVSEISAALPQLHVAQTVKIG